VERGVGKLEWVLVVYLAGMIGALLVGRVAQLATVEFIGGMMLLGVILMASVVLSLLGFSSFSQRRREKKKRRKRDSHQN